MESIRSITQPNTKQLESVKSILKDKYKDRPTEGALYYFNSRHTRAIKTIRLLEQDEHIGEIVKHLLGLLLKDDLVSYCIGEGNENHYLETAENFVKYIEKINTALMVAPETVVCGLVNGEFRIRLDYEKEYCSKEVFLLTHFEKQDNQWYKKWDAQAHMLNDIPPRHHKVVIIDNPNEFLKTYKKDSEEE